MVVLSAPGGHAQQRQGFLQSLDVRNPVVEVVLHHGRVAEKAGEPVNLHVGARVGNGGQRVDAQLGPLGDVKGVRDSVLISPAPKGRNFEVGDFRADVLDVQPAGRRFICERRNARVGRTCGCRSRQQGSAHGRH